jgi:alcohol dehydrogenase
MKSLQLTDDRALALVESSPPVLHGARDVLVRMSWVAINRLDLFASDGMAFARQRLPMTVGVEGAGIIEAVGPGVATVAVGDRVALYPGVLCGACEACAEKRENLCSGDPLIRGFNTNGVAAERVVLPETEVVPVPNGVRLRDAACVPVTAATVEHMICDNAALKAGETILIQAGGSGIGSVAISLAKRLGATVITTVGSDEKAAKAIALGADHVINYRTQNFSSKARRLTGGHGVHVVFEHVGADTWDGSLRSLRLGGRLVTCGSHTGVVANTNLLHLFNRQIRIFASFGGSLRNVREGLRRLRDREISISIDSVMSMAEMGDAMERLRARSVFGKLVLRMPGQRANEELGPAATGLEASEAAPSGA